MQGPAGDALHYTDGAHRWVPSDPTTSVDAWRAMIAAHVDEAALLGGCDVARQRQRQQNSRPTGWRPASAA
ncbi:hypothetical protein [Micromonospora sp. NPDC049679]|uniref:hypothetical protein n=1 Tax=Micromonospora sp. NPDC049679 TaxID=3155920 RepID=UPI0033C94A6C